MLFLNQKRPDSIESLNSPKFSKLGLIVGQKLLKLVNYFLFLFIGAYRTIGTTYFGGSCKFHPSCSQLALEAIDLGNPVEAVKIIVKRLSKCHPLSRSSGYDPIYKYLKAAHAE